MPGACRLGDKANCPLDIHGCQACSHNVKGPAVQGSGDVIINGKPAVRIGDMGIHATCCGLNSWAVSRGAPTVFINGKPAARTGDSTVHCGGFGKMENGSGNVIIGNDTSKLFKKAALTGAPCVAADDESFIQRIKRQAQEYLQERGTHNYVQGNYVASYIDAIGESMLMDVPETAGAAAVGIGTDIAFGKALKTIGKGAKLLLTNLDKLSEPLLSKVKTVFKKAETGKNLTEVDKKVIAGALDEIEGKATKNNDFVGKLKGEPVKLSGVRTQRISYTKRSPEDTAELRKQFNSTGRKKFLKSIANDPENTKQLKEAGFSELDIKKMKAGKVPGARGEWDVHHKLPLDDGGTNSFDNLILMRNDPYHRSLTGAQNALTKGMQVGQKRVIDWPIPDAFVYPTK